MDHAGLNDLAGLAMGFLPCLAPCLTHGWPTSGYGKMVEHALTTNQGILNETRMPGNAG